MKRSELKRQILENGFVVTGYMQSGPISDTLAEEVLGELEARAGWRWDPEEEPLPERLVVAINGAGLSYIAPENSTWAGGAQKKRSLNQAVYRHNAWLALRSAAAHLIDCGAKLCIMEILDGKEGDHESR